VSDGERCCGPLEGSSGPVMGVEKWQARWHAPHQTQEKRGLSRQIVRAICRGKWHALAGTVASQSDAKGAGIAAVQSPFFPSFLLAQGGHHVFSLAERLDS